MKYLLIIMLFLVSCTKTQPIENKQVLVQIEAVYIDGNSDLSPIVVAR